MCQAYAGMIGASVERDPQQANSQYAPSVRNHLLS